MPQISVQSLPGGGALRPTWLRPCRPFFTISLFEECLVGVVNQGGDADTTGAISGMIAGAFYGMDSLPKKWLKKLDPAVHKEVRDLAERLVDLSPLGQQF